MPEPEHSNRAVWLDALAAEYTQLGDGERIVICHSLACALWYEAGSRNVLDRPADRVLLVAPPGPSVLGQLERPSTTGTGTGAYTPGCSRPSPRPGWHQHLDPEQRRRLTLACQWYWRADADTDTTTRFIAWWLVIECLEMVKTTDIRPVRERLAELIHTPRADWREPVGRLFGLRSRLVHGEADTVETGDAALVGLIAKTLLTAQLLDEVPTALEADFLAASGLTRRG